MYTSQLSFMEENFPSSFGKEDIQNESSVVLKWCVEGIYSKNRIVFEEAPMFSTMLKSFYKVLAVVGKRE